MFKITITETKTVKKMAGKEWSTIGTKEVPREKSFYDNDESEPKTRIEDVRGYTPEIEKFVEVTNTVLSQEIETMDLAKVIKAINNL
jgi:hypothetical protein